MQLKLVDVSVVSTHVGNKLGGIQGDGVICVLVIKMFSADVVDDLLGVVR